MQKAIDRLLRRIRLMIARGVVELVNDSKKCQVLQVSLLSDEPQDDVERFQDYGITSVPFKDAEVLFLSVGGNRDHGVVICVNDRRYRPLTLSEGDVALHTDKGVRVHLDRASDVTTLGALASDGALDWVARGTRTESRLAALESFAGSHVHGPGTYAVAAAPGPVTADTFSSAASGAPTSPGTVVATKVKVV